MTASAELLQPIVGDRPAATVDGARDIYDDLKDARREDLVTTNWRKGIDPPPKLADWPKVIRLATEILTTRAKNLQVAGLLTEALVRRDGVAGLREGLQLVNGIMDQFWEVLDPPLEVGEDAYQARVDILNWLGGERPLAPRLELVPINKKGHTFKLWKELKLHAENGSGSGKGKLSVSTDGDDGGELTLADFDAAVLTTPKAWYKSFLADLRASTELLTELEAICVNRMLGLKRDDLPSLSKLRQAVAEVEGGAEELLARKLEIDPDPDVTVDPGAEIGANGTGTDAKVKNSVVVPNDSSLPVELRNLDDATARLRELARYLRRRAPGDPGPYLMVRGLRWGELRSGGHPLDDELLVAPLQAARIRIKSLSKAERWHDALEACEDLMAGAEGRGWLDLQTFAVSACQNLGGEFEQVATAIRGQLWLLLRDFPDLPERTLMDETPTASTKTRQWLQELTATSDGPNPAVLTGTPDSPTPEPNEPRQHDALLETARDVSRRSGPKRALELLTQQVTRERTPRARWIRTIQLATVMVESGREPLARPLLDELYSAISEHKLDEWESGALVARPMTLLHQVLTKLDTDEQLRSVLYARICKLDPTQALDLAP